MTTFTESFTKYNNLKWIRTDGVKEDNGYIKAYGTEILLFSENGVKMNGEGIITNEPVAKGFIPEWAKVVPRDPKNYVNFQVGDILVSRDFPTAKRMVEARSGNIIFCTNVSNGNFLGSMTTLEAYTQGWRVELTPYEKKLKAKEEKEKIQHGEPVVYKLTKDSVWKAGRFDRYAGRCFYVRETEEADAKLATECLKLTSERIDLIGKKCATCSNTDSEFDRIEEDEKIECSGFSHL